MGFIPRRFALIVSAFVFAACAPGGGGPRGAGPDTGAAPSQPKTLTIALQGEPKAINTVMGGEVGGSPGGHLAYMMHQRLAMYDNKGNPFPQLAAELPAQDKGTWVIAPDGTMRTTYRLRPNVRWHDGQPLTAQDVRFAWTVTMDPQLPVTSRSVASQMTGIDTPDELTVVVNWARPYPLANVVAEDDVMPLPSHLLRDVYEADKDRFQRLPYWGSEFVGVGPYRLDSWELGSHVVAKANDDFYGGRPKIDTLIIRFIPDEATLLANLMAASVDGEFRALDFDKVMVARDQMEAAGHKPLVIAQATFTRLIRVQYQDPKPVEITDLRVRKGLLMAIDRAAMADTIYRGQSSAADQLLATDDPKYDWVKDAITRYPYDPRQAQQLLAEVGWVRGADGAVRDARGDRVTLSHWTTQGGQWEADQSITADAWRGLGLAVDQYVIPTAIARDRENRAKFPNFTGNPIPFRLQRQASVYMSAECPTDRTRWQGDNDGCYRDEAMDRVSQALLSTVDPAQQRELWAEKVRLETQNLPALPLYYHMQGAIFREGVTGIKGEPRGASNASGWDVLDWDIR